MCGFRCNGHDSVRCVLARGLDVARDVLCMRTIGRLLVAKQMGVFSDLFSVFHGCP